MAGAEPPGDVDAISSLGDRNRRALYDCVVGRGGWTSREQAAQATGIGRATAAHHLDRLAEDGLLEVDHRRLTGRTGPGAGRPAKVYRRAPREVVVSLPPRRYELAGRILAAAADRSRLEGIPVTEAIEREARRTGRRLGEEIEERLARRPPATGTQEVEGTMDVLAAHGYEPTRDDDGTVVLRNCPFHHLAQAHTDLICGMNLCLLTEAVDRLDAAGLRTALEPAEGHCCVRLHTAS